MGHHIDRNGRFQSDRHPSLPPDFILLSYHDTAAKTALGDYRPATLRSGKPMLNFLFSPDRAVLKRFAYLTDDGELSDDILARLESLEG